MLLFRILHGKIHTEDRFTDVCAACRIDAFFTNQRRADFSEPRVRSESPQLHVRCVHYTPRSAFALTSHRARHVLEKAPRTHHGYYPQNALSRKYTSSPSALSHLIIPGFLSFSFSNFLPVFSNIGPWNIQIAMPSPRPASTSGSTLAEARPEQDIEKDDDAVNIQDVADKPIDRGRDAWLAAFGAWWALFIAFGWTNSLGVLQNYYEKDLLRDYSASTIAWIASTQIFIMYGGGLVFGNVFDSYGPRWLLYIGGFAQVFGLMMVSISKEYYQIFLSQAICSALGASAIYYACLGSLASWFQAKRATAFGLAASGASVGGVIFPVMVDRLIDQVGFGWTMRAVAFIILGGLVIVVFTVKSRLTHTPKRVLVRHYIKPFTETPFRMLVISLSLFSFGLFLPFNFITAQAQTLGMSSTMANYLVAILNATR